MSRVTEIRYIGLGVPDIEAERQFYVDKWRLRQVAEQNGLIYFAAEGHDELYVLRLRQTDQKRVDVIALAAQSKEDVDALFTKVEAADCRVIHPPRQLQTLGGGYGFRFFSPDGLPYEVSSGVQRGEVGELTPGGGIPERISHIVMHSPDHKAAAQFFVDVLGFRVSDWLGEFMVFLRCNEWHHRIALLPGPACLNHVAYDFTGLDEMMRGVARVQKEGVELRWGPGRHTAGNNTFSYFVTPNGFIVEYTAELERVDDETWQPTVYKPGPGIMDQWGIGVGGPKKLPSAEPDAGLFQSAGV